MAKLVNWHGDDYPVPDDTRSGCKVSWYYYSNADDAQKASQIAEATAKRLESQGFDWGFQVPGTVNRLGEGSVHPGMWEVCIP